MLRACCDGRDAFIAIGRRCAARNNLAYAYREVGDLGRAIPLCESTLADCERVLGADHPLTKIVRANRVPVVSVGNPKQICLWPALTDRAQVWPISLRPYV
ncbi:tetratricopeptide repeat protein [Nonomuraea sp. NPDC049625]|uniref:tetratricopeptide repeat protein n=1 Tax=Nonomuraea sp. NPDC049625 TaxID=3155775 RepID=UPI0034455740